MKNLVITVSFMLIMTHFSFSQNEDPFIWLEDVDSQKSLEWVNKKNDYSLGVLKSQKDYQSIYSKNLEIYNSTDRIADPAIYGDFVYNFWQDKNNPRGIWRRTAIKSYLLGNPVWETLLDLDKLSETDGMKWVYKGATGLYPDYNKFMVSLSKGGGDAVVWKEFDVTAKSFVKPGFELPEAKGSVNWIDENTLMVATDFGEGMTTSGYSKQVKIWKRGTELKDARLVFEGSEKDMGIYGVTNATPKKTYQMVLQRTSFFTGTYFMIENEKLIKLDLPEDIVFSEIFNDLVILQLKSDWNTGTDNFKQGSVISIGYNDLITGKKSYKLIVAPDERSSITGISATKNVLLVNMLNNVKSELYKYSFNKGWKKEKLGSPKLGNITLGSTDENSDNFFFYFTNFLEPSTLYNGNASTSEIKKVKSLPSFFPTEKYMVQQFEVVSKDGTKIPYFVVSSKDIKYNGANPTLLYSYGGFEVPQLPSYNAVTGTAWLEKGGVYVLANIRGGGEFGPKWHQSGLKENRQRVYDDFHAVAESLIEKKITSAKKLGIWGGSNGGLLVGVAYTQRPDLYNAVVCQVPLFDMKRYNKLLAGASWMAEYGNPDIPEEWEYISNYSPYQNIKPGMKYPEVFFTTSTRDDRVHPGHARKAVAKMESLGYKVYYYENTEGGHAGASTNEQRAQMNALIFAYLQIKLIE
jgi:prolyl oligopeptidase